MEGRSLRDQKIRRDKNFKTMKNNISKKSLYDLTYKVISAAIEVHNELGPGLLESTYHKCMKIELMHREINFQTEMKIPLNYKNEMIDTELRCDLFIEDCLVVELKAVQEIHPIFKAQILTYMKLLDSPKGLLINFNSEHIAKEGKETFINELYRELDDV